MWGKGMRQSLRVAAVDAAHAWVELQRIGWTPCCSYVLCPACTEDPPDVVSHGQVLLAECETSLWTA
jgi:hypothetical protein